MMASIAIVQATLIDLPSIVDIYNQAINDGGKTADLSTITFEDKIDWFHSHHSPWAILVAKIEDKVVGYISISPYRLKREALKKSVEFGYYIDYNYQRQGIGKKLIQAAIDYARQSKFERVVCIILGINKPSIQLLEYFGFEQWGVLPGVAKIENEFVDHYYLGLKL